MAEPRRHYVLLVAKDREALAELRDLLREVSSTWRLHLATSAEAALAVLSAAPIDVLVCDAGVDPELLRTVREQHPLAMRLALSERWDLELARRCRGVAHQFLIKPLDSLELRAAISRGCRIREVLENRALLDLLARMPPPPALPAVCQELGEAIAASTASVESVGLAIEREPQIASRVLQLAGSAFFRVRRRIDRPADAVSLLGFDTIEALCIMAFLFSHFDGARHSDLAVESLREHCLAVGMAARRLARLEGMGPATADQCFLAGILHDTGKLALASAFPAGYRQVCELSISAGQPDHVSERQVFGIGHPEVTGYLMSRWRQSAAVIEALAFHHRPADCETLGPGPLLALHVADALEHERAGDRLDLLDEGYLSALGLRDRLRAWRAGLWGEEI